MQPELSSQMLEELEVEVRSSNRVLVVDDDPEVREVVAALLEDTYEVSTAADGAAGLEAAASSPVDLVIVDQRMPGMSGVELLVELCRRAPETVGMVLTAYSDVEPIVAAVNDGRVARFMIKPFDPCALRAAVAEELAYLDARRTLAALTRALEERRDSLARTLAELEQTQQALCERERMAMLGWLTSGLDDQLRSLFVAMRLVIQHVEDTATDADIVEVARAARRAVSSLVLQVRYIRGIADDRPLEVQPIPVDTGCFVRDVVDLFALEESGRKCRVETEVDRRSGLLVFAPALLSQALLALLRNAVRASSAGDPIGIRVKSDSGGTACFEVWDRGIGMDEELAGRALEPFFSAFDPPGLGLGLEIARRVAEAHGGRLEVQSRPSHGTTVRLWLGRGAAGDEVTGW